MDDTVGLVIVKSDYLPVIPAFPGKTLVKTYRAMQFTRKTIVPSFLRKQESIRMLVNAGLPDGFLLSQE